MSELIECVPNISEGRRKDVIDRMIASVSAVPGAVLLSYTSDIDHNRTVLTLVGSRDGLRVAITQLFAVCVEAVDLTLHTGAHPRMGAVDVVPFIPIQDVTMADCVSLSRRVGDAIANEFGIPVFLYGESASSEERRLLKNIRKGEFEGMAAKMARPGWAPDYGPAVPHPSAGVSAFGARPFLIAYNLQLDTPDVEIANAVARAVRASSGGLQNVQAMGVYLADRNQAQVSMNLLDVDQTPVHRVQELVKREAARYGARVVGAEIIGLIPQRALLDSAAYYLQVENYSDGIVLENAIAARQIEIDNLGVI